MIRFLKWPLLKSFKNWQFQTQIIKQKLKEYKDNVTGKYFDKTKETKVNINKIKCKI